jgi:hypothetical protein
MTKWHNALNIFAIALLNHYICKISLRNCLQYFYDFFR